MTGALAWRPDLARGAFTARLSRGVTHDAKSDETLAKALSLGMGPELPHRSGLNTRLPRRWGMSFGASHKPKDEDGVGQADSSSAFLSIRRSFEWRP